MLFSISYSYYYIVYWNYGISLGVYSNLGQMSLLNLEEIMAKFASLLLDVQIALEVKQVMVAHVRQFFNLTLCLRGGVEIPTFDQFSDIFSYLTKRHIWSYEHHSPLEKVTNKFLFDNLAIQDRIKEYKSDLSGYFIAEKLVDYINRPAVAFESAEEVENVVLCNKQLHQRLKVVLALGKRKITELSLEYVRSLWRQLAEEFELPSLTAVLKKIMDGSLTIVWLVLPYLVEAIAQKSKTSKSTKFFRTHRIIFLQADGLIIYDEKSMVSMNVANGVFYNCMYMYTYM